MLDATGNLKAVQKLLGHESIQTTGDIYTDWDIQQLGSGGGGNRTRVRGRTGASIYKLRPPFAFARRPVCDRPTVGLALLRCRASGEWLSFGAEPAR